jgi:hypothetical protein
MTPAGVVSEALTIIDACGLDRTQLKVATDHHGAIIRRGRRPSGTRVTLTRRGVTWYVTGGGAHWKGTSRHAAATQIAHIIEVGWR